MWTDPTATYRADAWPDVNAYRSLLAAQRRYNGGGRISRTAVEDAHAAALAEDAARTVAAQHSHGYLGDEHDGAPYCPVDDCSWNR